MIFEQRHYFLLYPKCEVLLLFCIAGEKPLKCLRDSFMNLNVIETINAVVAAAVGQSTAIMNMC